MRICGIDPMDAGALAILDTSDGCLQVSDMPTVKLSSTRHEVDIPALWSLVLADRPDKVYIEKMQPMPLGGNANFKRGGYLYLFRAIFAAALIPFVEVPPKEWQKTFGIKGEKGNPTATKDQSYLIASRIFPGIDYKYPGSKGKETILDGRCDASLIAEYGRRMERGNGN
ncbi:MAG: hypothetical protein LLG06_01795 [Desulfobacteraceae bacterium]|nr:hypothetical protein [Desulfobacteraceae bacterium]